jgi:cellobiose transport system substrate-binding protein
MITVAAALALTTTLAACTTETGGNTNPTTTNTGSTADTNPAPSGDKIELTLSTWGEFGYEDVINDFMTDHPNITVSQRKSDAAREETLTYLAAGSGLSDVVAVENTWAPEVMQFPDLWLPVPDALKDRWLPWKSAAVTDQDGVLRMYGVDAAPVAMCFNRTLFEEAGLPTDRAAVAELLAGDWSDFYELGQEFTQKTGKAWISSLSGIARAQYQSLEITFQDRDGTVVATTNPDLKAIYDQIAAAANISASVSGEEWSRGVGQDSFAVEICPSWRLGVIETAAPDSTSWDVAQVVPGTGVSWGGSFLAVPAQTAHPEEAQLLADFLTSPETQLKAFAKAGAFPSQVEALASPELRAITAPHFQDAPSGQIFADLAQAITVFPYSGPLSAQIWDFYNNALNRVDDGTDTPDASWDKFVTDVGTLS